MADTMTIRSKRLTTNEGDNAHWDARLTAIAQGDRGAFAEFFRHFAPQIKGFLLKGGRGFVSEEQAEELVQEVMLRVWQKAETYDSSRAKVTTWVYTIARNCRIDLLYRKASENMNTVDSDDIWNQLEGDDNPVDELQLLREQTQVRESMELLPPEQKQVVEKVFMEFKSHTEVADELQLPLGTVKSRVRLALMKLKVALADE